MERSMLELLANAGSPTYGFFQVLGPPRVWAGAIALVVTLVATPIARALALRWKVVDRPDGLLKPHARPIAYLGGAAVYLGWLAGLAFLFVVETASRKWTAGLALAGLVVLIVGLLDDLKDIKPKAKILGQVLAAGVLLGAGIGDHIVTVFIVPLRQVWPDLVCPQWLQIGLSVPMTIFLVVAACNATNLLDGLDGLCSGVTGIISLMFLFLAAHLAMWGYSQAGDSVRIVTSMAMAGAAIGFLRFNISPATIFLGDAGSMLLGLYVAAMILMFGERGIAKWVLGSFMIFGLPILDTSLAMLRRVRLHRPIFSGDRSHLYDQLVDRGYSVRQTVAICYGLSVFYGLMGVAIIVLRTRHAIPIYVGVVAVTLYLCYRWGFLRNPEASQLEETEGTIEPPEAGDAEAS